MNKIGQKIYIVVFFVVLTLPTIGFFMNWDFYDTCENRTKVELQEFEFSTKYADTLQDYYKDHLGFKQTMSHWNSTLKFNLFQSSLHPDKSVVGKNGFLFYTSKDDLSYASYTREKSLTDGELNNFYEQNLKRKLLLDSIGIEYYVTHWPSKASIYPEYLPNRLRIQMTENSRRIDQIQAYLKGKSELEVLDATASLLNAKRNHQVYRKHDTHWNNRGAFYAYQDLMNWMGEKPYAFSDFIISKQEIYNGDLLGLSGLCNANYYGEIDENFDLNKDRKSLEIDLDEDRWVHMKTEGLKDGKTILVFRDSYGSALIQFISLHYPDAYFVWSDYSQEIVDELNPDIIVVGKTERYF